MQHNGKAHGTEFANGSDNAPSLGKKARKHALRLQVERKSLPIWEAKDALVSQLKEQRTLVLIGETGSGKTTQLPQFLLDCVLAQNSTVACTQPRRVAATSIANRVSRERSGVLGQEVGYSVRFDDKTSAATRLKYMTDGMLLREALLDPHLKRYKAIVLDEAHERTLQTDVLFTLVKAAQEKRGSDLKLVVMSATLDAAKFVEFFPGAKAAFLEGRQYRVETFYTEAPVQSYIDAALSTVAQLHQEEASGDILVFLTGQDEIESVERLIKERLADLKGPSGSEQLSVVSIFAAQPPEAQNLAFRPAQEGTRKVILATNIAETSVTVPGVRFVVDSGCVKTRCFQAHHSTESLQVVPVSQAQARQRSGRAGREAPGKAFRLYTEETFWSLEATTPPEIQRVRLDTVVLQLKALGIANPLAFDFMDRPPEGALVRALELLHALGALDEDGKLTKPLGENLARLPVEPTLGRVLLAAAETGCAAAALIVAAAASSDQILLAQRQRNEEGAEAQKRFIHRTGDHLTLLNIYVAFEKVQDNKHKWCREHLLNTRSLRKAADIHAQLAGYLQQIGVSTATEAADLLGEDGGGGALRRALAAGYFMNAATLQADGASYRVVASGQTVHIHPSSVLCGKKAKCIVFGELIHTTRNYARTVTAIEASWLPELAPSVFSR